MDDLVQWIGEQLDADEKVVRDELCVNCGNPIVPLRSPLGITGYSHGGGRVSEDGEWERSWEGRRCQGSITGAEAVQNPARVLREIDSKRKLVAKAADADRYSRTTWANAGSVGAASAYRAMLRLLAVPYSDRPGYREEWRP